MVERRDVRMGVSNTTLHLGWTKTQCKRWGDKNMPADLKGAGFKTVVFSSDPEIHGGLWFRINYGK